MVVLDDTRNHTPMPMYAMYSTLPSLPVEQDWPCGSPPGLRDWTAKSILPLTLIAQMLRRVCTPSNVHCGWIGRPEGRFAGLLSPACEQASIHRTDTAVLQDFTICQQWQRWRHDGLMYHTDLGKICELHHPSPNASLLCSCQPLQAAPRARPLSAISVPDTVS
jgi:hypothetical protein